MARSRVLGVHSPSLAALLGFSLLLASMAVCCLPLGLPVPCGVLPTKPRLLLGALAHWLCWRSTPVKLSIK